jgi:hypothetical protein
MATCRVMALVPSTDELARLWRKELFLDCRWAVYANQAGVLGYIAEGEAGGRFVVAERWSERRAYMKPRRRDPDRVALVRLGRKFAPISRTRLDAGCRRSCWHAVRGILPTKNARAACRS